METTIKTSFKFAKEIQCNFITKNNPEHFDDEDGPIPGIKLFKDFNIYLEREYCEY